MLFPKIAINEKLNELPPPTEVPKDLFTTQSKWQDLVEEAASQVLLPQDKVFLTFCAKFQMLYILPSEKRCTS